MQNQCLFLAYTYRTLLQNENGWTMRNEIESSNTHTMHRVQVLLWDDKNKNRCSIMRCYIVYFVLCVWCFGYIFGYICRTLDSGFGYVQANRENYFVKRKTKSKQWHTQCELWWMKKNVYAALCGNERASRASGHQVENLRPVNPHSILNCSSSCLLFYYRWFFMTWSPSPLSSRGPAERTHDKCKPQGTSPRFDRHIH